MASESNKIIARTVANVVGGGKPHVGRYYDDQRTTSIDVVDFVDRPQAGVTTYSTLGLSDHPLYRDGEEFEVRAELVGACASRFTRFANAMGTAALHVAKSRWFVAPGVIFPDVFTTYEPDSPMKHALFVPPFLWDFTTLELPEKKVAWLLLVPISDAEMRFAEADRTSANLEKIFEEKAIDIYDLHRPSVM